MTKALTLEEELKLIDSEHDKRRNDLIAKGKSEFTKQVEQLGVVFDGLPEVVKEGISSGEITTLARIASKINGSPKRKKQSSGSREGANSKLNDAQMLAEIDSLKKFLDAERSKDEIIAKFKWSDPTFSKRMDSIKELVQIRKDKDDKRKKYWRMINKSLEEIVLPTTH